MLVLKLSPSFTADSLDCRPRIRAALRTVALMLLFGCSSFTAPLAAADHYTEGVKPLLADKCIACHGPLRSEAGLRLDAAIFIRKGGDDGPVVVDGKPAESRLIERVCAISIEERMPPEGEGTALTKEELAVLEKWITDGLAAPAEETYVASPGDHWAYQPIIAPKIIAPKIIAPEISARAISAASSQSVVIEDDNAVDRLLSDHQRELGLERLPSADRETWLRRVTMDLNGLPPTPQEVAEFLGNHAPDAYSRVVERLLARPAYGERWGRHWMDVWRYSDWDGYKEELRGSQRHIWHWRDWIIQSLNADKPYDQMIVEMLAGDEIAPTDISVLRATGFLARNYHRSNRHIWLDATVEHTAKAFLGMTVACARCHDHKYDPITQDQYYQFRAIFEPHDVRTEPLAGESDLSKAGIPRVFDARPDAKTYLLIRGNEKRPREDVPMMPGVPAGLELPFVPSAVSLPPIAYQPALSAAAEASAIEAAWQRLDKERQAAEPKLNELRELARSRAQNTALGSDPSTRSALSATQTDSAAADAAADDATDDDVVTQAVDDSMDPLEEALLGTDAAEGALVALQARYAADHAKADKLSDAQLQPLVRRAALSEQRSNLLAAHVAYRAALRSLDSARVSAAAATEKKQSPATQPAIAAPENAAPKNVAAKNATPANAAAKKAAAKKVAAKKVAKGKEEPVAAAEKHVLAQREAWTKAVEAAKTEPTTYTPVGTIYPQESTGRRLALARWIIDPRNPLTARVAANQIWMRHFGAPLVDDVADFGLRAKRPVTAPLLDWLASELLTSGWDMKQLHRQIVLSQSYRITSDTSSQAGQMAKSLDPENRLFARANVRRLDAEEIRDSLLAAADHIDRSVGGADLSEDEGEKVPRRSVYFRHAYEKQVAMLVLFDGPSPNECYRRSPSILPQQALALANSQLSRDLSRRLGETLHQQSEQQSAGDHTLFIEQLFLRVLSRQPTSEEREACREYLTATEPERTLLERRQSLAHALLNHNDFVVAR